MLKRKDTNGQNETINVSVTVLHADGNYPSAKVVNNFYGDVFADSKRPADIDDAKKLQLREEILEYVGKLEGFVTEKWVDRVEAIWYSIITLPILDPIIYTPGKQDSNFNRNLVANIVHMMRTKGIYRKDTDKAYTIALDGDYEKPVRGALPYDPEDKKICEAVKKQFK